jgi:gliding motility-associated-like protein
VGDSTWVNGVSIGNGYLVEASDSAGNKIRKYVWLTPHKVVSSVKWQSDTSYCNQLPLIVEPRMTYLSLSDYQMPVRRTLQFTYDVFEMQAGDTIFSKSVSVKSDSLFVITDIPTVNTTFDITEDGYDWKMTTDTFFTTAVNAFPQYSTSDKAENEIDEESGFEHDSEGHVVYYFDGGATFRSSGPLYLDLKSNASPKVDDIQWQIASDSAFTNPYTIYNKPTIFNYKFSEAGTHCIKLIVKNKKSGCNYESAGCFKIVSSALYIPNTFTPNGDGKNDKFKVAYSSIKSYTCRIYNQWGRKIYDSDDITEGWDGKIGSSEAPTGVYFYIITAKGTDGTDYDKKGTLNLLRSAK